MTHKPKLIEVALPLAAINEAAAAEGSIGQRPHPKNLHRWWARRPLAAARAVIWASLVDDPSCDETLSVAEQQTERERLFRILERLVVWEIKGDVEVLKDAKAEIDRCFPDGPPPILDPFGGGGAIPIEAQRLGLKALSGDLNPVAVLIQKAMLEIPLRFADRRPVHPDLQVSAPFSTWERTQGLAADIEAYGRWMRDEAHRRIGHLYPDVAGHNGERLTPIAWIWARTVESPDPSWNGHVPLVASWTLAKKPGKPLVWIEPVVDRTSQTITYVVREGGTPTHNRTVDRGHGTCVATGSAIPGDYIKAESRAGRLGQQLIAIVAEGASGRTHVAPTAAAAEAAASAEPPWRPEGRNPEKLTGGTVFVYGLDEWWKLFTPRQLTGLATFSDILHDLRPIVEADAARAGFARDGARIRDGGSGAAAYADAVLTYLAFVVDKFADFSSSLCGWNNLNSQIRNVFARQSVAMTWDFAEVNPFSGRVASWDSQLDNQVRCVRDSLGFGSPAGEASVVQRDARARVAESVGAAISSDPPYYDNISYADLSDFFYIWLRKGLGEVWPNECATLLTPKAEELIANQHRAGSRLKAERYFESGMSAFMENVSSSQAPGIPATIYYAYMATESSEGEIRSTGWDTFLQAVLDSGMRVTATWPLRTERQGRMISIGANALASSIVLACRPRASSAPMASRGEFVAALRSELPAAVRMLQTGNIAPVDVPQSTIGPGIGVFSRFSKVVESDGSVMRVSVALAIINDVLGEILDGEESEMDADSRFALAWYSQYGYNPAASGEAINVARAKNTSVDGAVIAGIAETRAGKFRLYERSELPTSWIPTGDMRLTVWEATQQLMAALDRSEAEAAALLHQLGGYGERARTLAYLLFKKATDKGWATEAGAYNALITAWPTLRSTTAAPSPGQTSLPGLT